jgi:uncharacterized cupin superfamily protein
MPHPEAPALADQPHAPEARLDTTPEGLKPTDPGWFVVNAADCRWYGHPTFGACASLEGDAKFAQVGVNIHVLQPGQPACMYHRERDQEGFLVLSGECLLLVDGHERALKAWDYVHCPQATDHVFVGAGQGPCAILMLGARSLPGVHYPRSDLALRHEAGVETATDSPEEAYAPFAKWEPCPSPWAELG